MLGDAPFDGDALTRVCQEIENELGVKVIHHEYKLKKPVSSPKTLDDLRALMPNAVVLKRGDILYPGWDISDRWAVLQDADGIHVFYSTNAHGQGFDHHIKPGENVGPFLRYLEENDCDWESVDCLLRK